MYVVMYIYAENPRVAMCAIKAGAAQNLTNELTLIHPSIHPTSQF